MRKVRFRVSRLAFLIIAAAAVSDPTTALAQTPYPERPIRLIVPFPPAARPAT